MSVIRSASCVQHYVQRWAVEHKLHPLTTETSLLRGAGDKKFHTQNNGRVKDSTQSSANLRRNAFSSARVLQGLQEEGEVF